jgi:16S rRNA A1518/A1519 N6-dimethyltransferase RsmA/KsgA/DIM1 with predicted DNA glycosylase/AP lyase activity
MAVEIDPQGYEREALLALADFNGRRVLEIGAGDCRLTWLYAHQAASVTAVEPFRPAHERATADLPGGLRDRVTLCNSTFDGFAGSSLPSSFDLVFLSWSL